MTENSERSLKETRKKPKIEQPKNEPNDSERSKNSKKNKNIKNSRKVKTTKLRMFLLQAMTANLRTRTVMRGRKLENRKKNHSTGIYVIL